MEASILTEIATDVSAQIAEEHTVFFTTLFSIEADYL